MLRVVPKIVTLGAITCPSGELVLMDGGYLRLWSADRAPGRLHPQRFDAHDPIRPSPALRTSQYKLPPPPGGARVSPVATAPAGQEALHWTAAPLPPGGSGLVPDHRRRPRSPVRSAQRTPLVDAISDRACPVSGIMSDDHAASWLATSRWRRTRRTR